MAYTCSAMTHIMEDIRLDGLKFLSLWLEVYPVLMPSFADKVIPNYISLLSANGKTKTGSGIGSSVLINPSSQLGSSKNFIAIYTNADLWAGLEQKDDPNGGGSLVLFGAAGAPAMSADRLAVTAVMGATGQGNNIQNSYELTKYDHLKVNVIMPILVDFWLEASSTVFGVGSISQSPALAVMETLLKTMNLLWRAFLVGMKDGADLEWVDAWLKTILKHFVVHFPFGAGNYSMRDAKVELILQNMNILFCELLSHFVLAADESFEAVTSRWRDRMFAYMLELLGEKPAETSESSHLVMNLKVDHLEATYPVLWTLLNRLPDDEAADLFQVFVAYHNGSHNHAVLKSTFKVLSRILLLQNHSQYAGAFRMHNSADMLDAVRGWISTFLKRLWVLKAGDPGFSIDILLFLTQCLKEDLCGSVTDKTVAEPLQASLVPFFHVMLPKGPVFGPFVELPEAAQRAALQMVFYLPSWPEKLVKGLAACLNDLRVSSDVVCYAMEIIDERQRNVRTQLPLTVYVSILVTIGLVGYNSAEMSALGSHTIGGNRICGTEESVQIKKSAAAAAKTVTGKWKQNEMSPAEEQAKYWDRREALISASIPFFIYLSL
ncbi:Testis-expressed sequence 10 protein [Borealophlyctis nickersoniae]|nr:Testis-expressed sequence 10 protein [Borealophlyctis nickersoniae]